MSFGWESTEWGQTFAAVAAAMQVSNLRTVIGPRETSSPPLLWAEGPPESIEVVPPLRNGGRESRIVWDRVVSVRVQLWALSPAEMEAMVRRYYAAFYQVVPGAGRVTHREEQHAGSAPNTAGAMAVILTAIRYPVSAEETRMATVLTAAASMGSARPDQTHEEDF